MSYTCDGDTFTAEALELLDVLYGTALRWTRQADFAQDLVQDTYLKGFRAQHVAQPPAGPRASRGHPETLLLRATLDVDLRAALDALPEVFREAVWLRDVEELTYEEIATVLGAPIGTVMSRISRGRKQLYAELTVRRRATSA